MFTCTSFAQQDSQFTQYMYNTISINPAYAGSRGVLSMFGLHRSQWIGIDGAPVTNTAAINSPMNDTSIGLGLSFVNDRIGPSTENTISIDLSYSIQTSERYKLSFGLKATANFFSINMGKLHTNPNVIDPTLLNYNEFTPNIGAGIYLHSDKTYFGFSVPNFIETNRYSDNRVAIYKEKMTYYCIAGHVFDLSTELLFKPALLTKLTLGAPLQIDVSANFMFYEKLVLGVAYRWDASVSAIAGFQVTESWYIGYAYDRETTRLQNYNSGSHEFFLRHELFNNVDKIISPRFF